MVTGDWSLLSSGTTSGTKVAQRNLSGIPGDILGEIKQIGEREGSVIE